MLTYAAVQSISNHIDRVKIILTKTSHLPRSGQSKSKIILSQGVVERPALENFMRQPEIFLCAAASETERERPRESMFYDETVP